MEHQPLRSADVRDRNQKLILRLLFQEGAMSQSQLVQRTGLKAPTVFRIFAKLEEDHYIRPCGEPERAAGPSDRKGRRPVYYCVVPSAAFAVGVDFSTAGVSVIVVNFVNEVIHHQNQEFTAGINRDEVLSRIGALIGSALDACSIKPQQLIGIGIGSPGIVDTETGVVVEYSRIEGLTDYSLTEHFQSVFHVPVFVHNNASVIAASEYHYGAARDYSSVLAILVRGGVGGAFVNHGRLFVNGSTTALELGRTSVCVCGTAEAARDPQPLESVVGELPLLERLRNAEPVAGRHEAQERLTTDRIAEILREPSAILGTAVRNLYHILHPEAVLVISRYASIAAVLQAAIAEAVPETTVIAVRYDPVKACYGATDLVFQQFFTELPWNSDTPTDPGTGSWPTQPTK
jgi:predicted NBD/HSP70 family sugar kinase